MDDPERKYQNEKKNISILIDTVWTKFYYWDQIEMNGTGDHLLQTLDESKKTNSVVN